MLLSAIFTSTTADVIFFAFSRSGRAKAPSRAAKEQCAAVVLKLLELGNAFGKPHGHSGLGIRKLRADLLECRIGLGLRLLFRVSPDSLILRFIGSHGEVQKYLRTF